MIGVLEGHQQNAVETSEIIGMGRQPLCEEGQEDDSPDQDQTEQSQSIEQQATQCLQAWGRLSVAEVDTHRGLLVHRWLRWRS